MKRNRIWVVEFLDDKRYLPTVGVGLTRDQAVKEMKDWRDKCRYDKFRVKAYEAKEANNEETT